jgi:hypothetical protein
VLTDLQIDRLKAEKGVDPRQKDSDTIAPITFKFVAEQWFQTYKAKWKDFARNRHAKSLARDIMGMGKSMWLGPFMI